MSGKGFTPALGWSFLTPVYDISVALVSRENVWRGELIRALDPRPGDRILDVGCGTGTLAIRLWRREPGIRVTGIDPDPGVLLRARRKSGKAGAEVNWIEGFLDEASASRIGPVNKIVSSLVLHQTALDEKKRILSVMRELLEPGGALVIADFGLQRTAIMRALFRCTVQVFDGVTDTQPNAEGRLMALIEEAGFDDVEERRVVPTATGSISVYTAIAGARKPGSA